MDEYNPMNFEIQPEEDPSGFRDEAEQQETPRAGAGGPAGRRAWQTEMPEQAPSGTVKEEKPKAAPVPVAQEMIQNPTWKPELKHVEEKADFMMGNLGLFFLPVSSGVMKYTDIIFENAIPLLTVCVVSTALTFGATAWTVQLTCRLLEKRKEAKK